MLKVKPTPDRFHREEFSPRRGVVCDAGIMANYVNCEPSETTSQINFKLKENNANTNWCRPCEGFRRWRTMWCSADWASYGGLQQKPAGIIPVPIPNSFREGHTFCLRGGKT